MSLTSLVPAGGFRRSFRTSASGSMVASVVAMIWTGLLAWMSSSGANRYGLRIDHGVLFLLGVAAGVVYGFARVDRIRRRCDRDGRLSRRVRAQHLIGPLASVGFILASRFGNVDVMLFTLYGIVGFLGSRAIGVWLCERVAHVHLWESRWSTRFMETAVAYHLVVRESDRPGTVTVRAS